MENKLTSGSVLKNIIRFSLPYLLSYFLQTLYGMADLYIIGQSIGANQKEEASKLFVHTLFPMGLAAGAVTVLSYVICIVFYMRMKRSA